MTLLEVAIQMVESLNGRMSRKQAASVIKNKLRELIKNEGAIHVTLDNGEKLTFSEKELAAIWKEIK